MPFGHCPSLERCLTTKENHLFALQILCTAYEFNKQRIIISSGSEREFCSAVLRLSSSLARSLWMLLYFIHSSLWYIRNRLDQVNRDKHELFLYLWLIECDKKLEKYSNKPSKFRLFGLAVCWSQCFWSCVTALLYQGGPSWMIYLYCLLIWLESNSLPMVQREAEIEKIQTYENIKATNVWCFRAGMDVQKKRNETLQIFQCPSNAIFFF